MFQGPNDMAAQVRIIVISFHDSGRIQLNIAGPAWPKNILELISIALEPFSSDLFPTGDAAIAFFLVILAWLLSELIGGQLVPTMRRGGAKVERRNVGSNLMLLLAITACLSLTYVFARLEVAMLPAWVFYVGLALMIAGIALRQWAVAVLGRYFSVVIGVQDGQRVVDAGPYRFVRHPSYTGFLLILVGIGLAAQSWGAALLIFVTFGLILGHRIVAEERVLVSELGEEYVDYMGTTKRLIPFLI